MRYWWVNHRGSNHAWMLDNKALWSERYDRAGNTPPARAALGDVKSNDKIFSYFRGHIHEVLTAIAAPNEVKRYGEDGWWLNVEVDQLDPPLLIDPLRADLLPL